MAANVHSQSAPTKTSSKARRQPLDPKRASRSLPSFQLQCISSPKSKQTSSGRVIPVAVTGKVSRATLGRLHDEQLRNTPPEDANAVPPLSPGPLGLSFAALSKPPKEKRPNAAATASNANAAARPSEPPKAICTPGQSAPPSRRLSKSRGLKPRHPTETLTAEPTHDHASLDVESQSMLVPTNRGSLFRRLFWPIFKKPQSQCTSTRSLAPSTSRTRNRNVRKSAMPSSHYVKSSVGTTSSRETQGGTTDESRSQMMKALFLNLFMFAATVLCMMAFFRLSDVAHDLDARGGNLATTGLPTVAPPGDFVENIVPRHIQAVAHGVNRGTVRHATGATLTQGTSIAGEQSLTAVEDTTTESD